MFRGRLILHLAFASLAALCLASIVDLIVGHEGGFSFLYWIFDRATNGPSAWAGLRDGLLGNLLFFLCAGIVVSVSTWSNPQELPFVYRLMAMFPHLENHIAWIDPIVSLVKEDASIALESETVICFEDYDAIAKAYKIDVSKRERIASLLKDEPYEDTDFQVRVSADLVDGKQDLGLVKEAIVKSLPREREYRDGQSEGSNVIDLIKKNTDVNLKPGKLDWGVEDETVKLPAGMDGIIILKYWVYGAIGKSFTSLTRRPARKVIVKLKATLPSSPQNGPSAPIPVRLLIKGETERGKVFDLQIEPAGAEFVEVSFSPRRRRPVLQLEFGAPGTTLSS